MKTHFSDRFSLQGIFYAAFVASTLWFDIQWCMATRFSAFGTIEIYLSLFGLPLLLCAPVFLRGTRRLQAAILAVYQIWLVCNIMYSRTYFAVIPAGSYLLFSNLTDFTGSVTDSLRISDLLYPVIFIAALLLSRHKKGRRADKKIALTYGLTLLAIIAAMCICTIVRGGGEAIRKKIGEHPTHHANLVPMYTPLGSIINDIFSPKSTVTDAERAEFIDFMDSQPDLTALPDSVARDYDNIVMIFCESLESWPIGLQLEGKEITPVLNALIADSSTLYIPNLVSQVGTGRSIDAQLLLNAGLMPPDRIVYSSHYTDNTFGTLTKALGAPGILLTVDKPVMWNQGAVARAFGIDEIISKDDWDMTETTGDRGPRIALSDGEFFRQSAEKLPDLWPEGSGRFVQFVTHSGHAPFVIPDNLKLLQLQGNYPTILCDYLVTANYTDHSLKTIIDYLRSRSDYDRTLIVITGDHEGLAAYRDDLASKYAFVSPDQRTPLIALNAPVHGRIDKIAGQVDAYPTLLRLAGLTAYPWHGVGRDILDDSHPGAAFDMRGRLEAGRNVSEPVQKRLLEEKRISDIILRGDLQKQ